MNNVHNLFDAMNLLAKHGVTGRESFEHLGEDFISEMREIEASPDKLDKLIQVKIDSIKFNQHDNVQVQQLKNLQEERKDLQKSYNKITANLELYANIQNFNQVKDKQRKQEKSNHIQNYDTEERRQKEKFYEKDYANIPRENLFDFINEKMLSLLSKLNVLVFLTGNIIL